MHISRVLTQCCVFNFAHNLHLFLITGKARIAIKEMGAARAVVVSCMLRNAEYCHELHSREEDMS